ncbi:MAG TPA: hypothetical protein VGG27_09300 [Magnetospirillaceae bacterium]|jgi:hypothetical protein
MRVAETIAAGLAFLSASFLAVSAAYAQPPVDYQDPPPYPDGAGEIAMPLTPGQVHGTLSATPLTGTGNFQRMPMIDESGFIVVDTRKEPYWKAGLLDPVLTNACRIGNFTSVPLNRMVVRFESSDGRAALSYIPPDRRHLLVDTQNLAKPGEIYYFFDASYTDCQVYVENPAKPLRRLTAGTSLDKPDPKALAKKKALIQSWEKPAAAQQQSPPAQQTPPQQP